MKDVISKHIFTFPFKWDCEKDRNNKLKYFEDILKKSDYEWLRVEHAFKREIERIDVCYTNIKTSDKENKEMTGYEKVQLQNILEYYYPEVKKIMFDFQDKKEWLRCYQLDFDSGVYDIKISDQCKYELKIEKIILKVYETGVALLSYFVDNETYKLPSQILDINQFGRRIKWPFIKLNDESKIEYDGSKEIATAEELSIRFKSSKLKDINGNFTEFTKSRLDSEKKESRAYILPINKIVTELLGKGFIRSAELDNNKISYDLVIDDRMHVISYYFDYGMIPKERKSFFYEYTFVDSLSSSSDLTDEFRTSLIDKNSYQRWISHNYGISNYSFVCLGIKNGFNENVINTHIQGIYYEMISIYLMQKASLQKFSSDLSKINSLKEFQKIQESYLDFIANYCYQDLTAQEQGIEIYDKVKRITGISEKIEQVNLKIKQLVDLYTQKNDAKSNSKMNLLTGMVGLLGLFSYYESIKTTEIRFTWQRGFIGEVVKIDDTFNYLRQIKLPNIIILAIYFIIFFRIVLIVFNEINDESK